MKSVKTPAFQFYPKDFLSDGNVQAMTLEQVGAYWILLCHDWNEGGLPDDPARLAKWCKVSVRKFATIWEIVREMFPLATDGRRYNPRLASERKKQKAYRRKAREFGKRGAAKKWGTPSEKHGHPISKKKGRHGSASASSSSIANPPKSPAVTGGDLGERVIKLSDRMTKISEAEVDQFLPPRLRKAHE